MKTTDTVFELIQTLTKGEKRNLIQLANLQKGEKDYILLFTLLDKMDEYDESALKPRFKNFAYTKNYLYNFILKSLAFFDNSSKATLASGIRNVHHLMEKGLHGPAMKLLKMYKKTAVAEEHFSEWEELLDLEISILRDPQDLKGLRKKLDAIKGERKSVEEKRKNLREYDNLYNEFLKISQTKYFSRGEIDHEGVLELESKSITQNVKNALSLRARLAFWLIRFRIDFFDLNYASARKTMQEVVSLFEKNDFLKVEQPERYIVNLSALAGLYSENNEIAKAKQILEKLENFHATTEHISTSRFEYLYSIVFGVALDSGDFDFAFKHYAGFEADWKKYHDKISDARKILLYFQVAKLHLLSGNPKEASRWVRLLIDSPKVEIREDIQAFARFLQLIIQYELGDPHDLMDSYVNAAYKYFQRRQRLFKFESALIRFLRGIPKKVKKEQLEAHFLGFKKDLEVILEDPKEIVVLGYFDFLTWIDSKIKGISFQQALKLKK